MPDKLSVTLEAKDAAQETAKVEKFRGSVISADKAINDLSKNATPFGDAVGKQLNSADIQAHNLNATLRKIAEFSTTPKGIDGLGKAAIRAQAELQGTFARLRQLEAEMATTRDPQVLKRLKIDIAETTQGLDRLQNKIDRVAAGRQASAARNPGGSGFNGRGLVNTAAGAGVPGAFEGSLALDAAAALGIGTAALAVFAAVAAAGVAIVKVSEHIRSEADRRLKTEEGIAKAANAQLISSREQLITFQKADALRERERKFQEHLAAAGTADRDSLQRQIDLLKKLRDINPTGPNAEEFNANIQAAEQRLNALNKKATTDADANFNQRNENFKAAQLQAIEFEKKRVEAANAGRQRVNELGKTADELFQRLFATAGSNNPFVQVFSEADRSIESTRLATSALSKDLQKTAADLVATQNANALFSARLDSTLSAVNLRADAAGFRNAGSTKTADDIAARALARFKQDLAEGTFRNPENLAIFRSGTSPQTGLELFNFQRQLEQSGGLFRNPIFDDETRRQLAEQPANQTVAERLQKQLDAIATLTPGNDTQRADIDRRIIALTQGLRPEDLTDAQRGAAATARENEAARAENAEAAARAQRAESLDVQKRIDKNIAELLKVANSDGLTGVIRIINNAEDNAAVELGKRPTARDVTQLTDQ